MFDSAKPISNGHALRTQPDEKLLPTEHISDAYCPDWLYSDSAMLLVQPLLQC